jgi:hypothetical protein
MGFRATVGYFFGVLVLVSGAWACSSEGPRDYRPLGGTGGGGGTLYTAPLAGTGGYTAGTGGQGASLCGNGVIDTGEQCDGTNLDGETCASLGYGGGVLACLASTCTYDTSMCNNLDSGYGAGGTGGTGGTGGGDDAGDEDAGN